MKRNLFFFIITILLFSCTRQTSFLNLTKSESIPIYYIEIQDSDEAGIIKQETGINIIKIDSNKLYFNKTDSSKIDKLEKAGYKILKADPYIIYNRLVAIERINKKSEDVKKLGVFIINEEDSFWIARGNIKQIKELKKQGFKIKRYSKEVRPRLVKIIINQKEDIQSISETNMDIFSAEKLKDSSYVIYGNAYDYQIEKIRNKNIQVFLNPK